MYSFNSSWMDVNMTLELRISTTFGFELWVSSVGTTGARAIGLDESSALESLLDRWPC